MTEGRLYVQLTATGSESPVKIVPGGAVTFTGTVVANDPAFLATARFLPPPDLALLTRQAAHLAVRTTDITIG